MAKRKTARQAGAPGDPRQRFAELVAAYQAGRHDEVAAGAEAFTRQWPDQVAGWNLLAEGYRLTGRLDEAERACRRALDLDPRSAEAHNNVGNLLRDRHDLETAERAFLHALSIKPGLVEARFNLGNVLRDRGRLSEAVAAYRAAIQQRPGEALYHLSLGVTLREMHEPEAAREALEQALAIRPDQAESRAALGNVLRQLGLVEAARAELDRAIALDPGLKEAHTGLGRLLHVIGDAEAAEVAYRRALDLAPDYARAWYGLTRARRFAPDDPEVASMEALLARPEIDDDARMHLHFALGKVGADGDDDPDTVMTHFREGCRLKRATLDYDADDNDRCFERIAQAFPREWIESRRAVGDPTDAPIFVVGMPRSGTTLVEQILSSHARVHGAGERNDLGRLVRELGAKFGSHYPQWVDDLSESMLRELGHAYRRRVIEPFADADRVVDKMPANFLYLGLIATALPNARIVHVRRDPMDTCLSCFTLLFSGWQPFSYDLEELGRYYRAYARLMAHWREVLPTGRMLELDYESITGNFEPAVRSLLNHCGLEWDPRCLEFHATERMVTTASTTQVRRPLYRTSVGRWRRYRDQLQPLMDALGPLASTDLENA
ncbi:MAG: sulfotransferase [Halofilum sp. (in: g-proteobacteria)]|nr:sulfotransferase [Halofilum sp. (in: g-proteobacteria)]